jgi:3D (Asp-Asp-Asp) domain-containing protein
MKACLKIESISSNRGGYQNAGCPTESTLSAMIAGDLLHRVFKKGLLLGLFSSLLICITLPGKLNSVFAADNPSAQSTQIEIPGSFKELTAGKDRVAEKRLPGQIEELPKSEQSQLEIDDKKVTGPRPSRTQVLIPEELIESEMLEFNATAYCLKGRTASGDFTQPGMIAADPRVLPLGTVVHINAGPYTGVYTVADTGGSIKGRRVDLYVPTHREAMQFGRRQVKIKILKHPSPRVSRTGRDIEAAVR